MEHIKNKLEKLFSQKQRSKLKKKARKLFKRLQSTKISKAFANLGLFEKGQAIAAKGQAIAKKSQTMLPGAITEHPVISVLAMLTCMFFWFSDDAMENDTAQPIDWDEYAWEVNLGGRYGLIDRNAKEIIKPQYEAISYDYESQLVRVKKAGKWGVTDRFGTQIIDHNFDDIGDFREGRAYAKQNGAYGVIDEEGDFVLEPRFDKISDFALGVSIVTKDSKKGVIDRDGNTLVKPLYQSVEYKPIVTSGKTAGEPQAFVVANKQYAGLADRSGKIIVPLEFSWGSVIAADIFVLVKDNGSKLYNAEGDELYSMESWSNQAGNMLVLKNNGKYGAIDFAMRTVFDFVYENISLNDEYIILKQNGKVRVIDKQADTIIAFDSGYQDIRVITDNVFAAKKNGKWGLIDRDNTILVKLQYDEIHGSCGELTKFSNKNKQETVYKLSGEKMYQVNSKKYINYMPCYGDKLASSAKVISANHLDHGYINTKGETVIEHKYAGAADNACHGKIGVQDRATRLWALMDLSEKNIYGFIFDGNPVQSCEDEDLAPIYKAASGGKMLYLNQNGDIVWDGRKSTTVVLETIDAQLSAAFTLGYDDKNFSNAYDIFSRALAQADKNNLDWPQLFSSTQLMVLYQAYRHKGEFNALYKIAARVHSAWENDKNSRLYSFYVMGLAIMQDKSLPMKKRLSKSINYLQKACELDPHGQTEACEKAQGLQNLLQEL